MSGLYCKYFIDQEIIRLTTPDEDDRLTRTILKSKRSRSDTNYNAVSILTDDFGIVQGVNRDGIVYYPL